MKSRLIILSDLWGLEKSEWLIYYTRLLGDYYDIKYYDCCTLGEINKSNDTEKNLHHQFLNGGIERAVEKLFDIEKDKLSILAFSIGGTIAWKFGIKTSKIDRLICVSSTRLRYENTQPKGKILLYYGGKDTFKPDKYWFQKMKLNFIILNDKEHQFYKDEEFAKQLSDQLIENEKNNLFSL